MGEEHRCKARFDLFLPITISVLNTKSTISAVTRNVSSGGVYFYTQGSVQEGDALEFRLTLPNVLTEAGDMPAMCEGKVLRVEPHPKEGLSGVAVRIDAVTFLEPLSSTANGMQQAGET
ncbi:MAG TPA: PilZ domain-containing protein [Terriglobales bacterium]|jgi:hypothetical protein